MAGPSGEDRLKNTVRVPMLGTMPVALSHSSQHNPQEQLVQYLLGLNSTTGTRRTRRETVLAHAQVT
jgi:hypothetical protein